MTSNRSLSDIPKRFFIAIAVVIFCCGCGRPAEQQPTIASLLDSSVLSALTEADVPLMPECTFLKDSSGERNERTGIDSSDPLPMQRVVTSSVWLASDSTINKIVDYYRKTCPYVIRREEVKGKSIFVQLASVEDIQKAVDRNKTPIVLIDLRKKILSLEEKSAYTNELNGLRMRMPEDLASRRRIEQIERILAEKPLIKINIRQIIPD